MYLLLNCSPYTYLLKRSLAKILFSRCLVDLFFHIFGTWKETKWLKEGLSVWRLGNFMLMYFILNIHWEFHKSKLKVRLLSNWMVTIRVLGTITNGGSWNYSKGVWGESKVKRLSTWWKWIWNNYASKSFHGLAKANL